MIARWKGIVEEIHFGSSMMPLDIIENIDLEKSSFRPSKWPRKLKPAKNSKLPKLLENCFEPVGKGGWPPISTWIICVHSKQKVVATFVISTQSFSLQQKQVDRIVEEYRDIFSSPTGVPTHCQVKHPIDLTPGASLPNGPVYRFLSMENDEIKSQIQELLQKGHIGPNSSP
jgi:hypothetical protein